eukprot:403499-Karenia_brevis.AAC.1
MNSRLHDMSESRSFIDRFKANNVHYIPMHRWNHKDKPCIEGCRVPKARTDSTTSHKHDPHEGDDEHAHLLAISCVSSLTPLISRLHHPPVVSVQGEAANPGPHDEHVSHDAEDEANIT